MNDKLRKLFTPTVEFRNDITVKHIFYALDEKEKSELYQLLKKDVKDTFFIQKNIQDLPILEWRDKMRYHGLISNRLYDFLGMYGLREKMLSEVTNAHIRQHRRGGHTTQFEFVVLKNFWVLINGSRKKIKLNKFEV